MDVYDKITKWARTLEYRGNIPKSLEKLCNPSTTIIWEQLLTQIKPKQNVQEIRHSNLLVRLQGKAHAQGPELYPIKELSVWEKKCRLQQEIDEIKETIREKEKTASMFSNEHKIIAMKMNKIKDDIKESEGKAFLLTKKSEALKREILEVEENLTFLRNLTPVEATEDTCNADDTLRECVKKIQKLLLDQELKAPSCAKKNISLTPYKSSLTSIFTQSDCSLENYSHYEEYKNDVAGEIKFLNNKKLSRDIKTILYNTDSQSILNIILKDIESLKGKLLHIITNKNTSECPLEKDHQMELHAIQIENDLHALKYYSEIKKLKELLKNKQENINVTLEGMNISASEVNNIREVLYLQRKEAGLNALCECLEKQVTNCRSIKGAKDELRKINADNMRLQQNLVEHLRNLNFQYELYKKMYKTMLVYRDETKAFVRKSSQFTSDMEWSLPLTRSLHSKEIEVFQKFSLDYNRRLNTSNRNLYVRDIMNNITVDVETINPETLQIILILIDCPYSAPETIFYNLWAKKMKLQMQKSLHKKIKSFDFKTYTQESLEKEESFIDYAISKFNDISRKNFNKPSSQDVITVRQMAKFWLEMPFWKYILQSKLYEGKGIAYYQKMYDNYYDQIRK